MVTTVQSRPSTLSYRDAPPKFIAGARCLDFINTVEWRGDPGARGERLGSYAEFIVWAEAAGYVDAGEARRLRALSARSPARAAAVLREAIRFREALARLLDSRGLEPFNRILEGLPLAFRLERTDGALRRVPVESGDALRRPLDRIVADAVELVTSARLRAVSHCGNARCGWFFIDESRNRSRRWCDMAACGNSAKVRAHRARLRRGHRPS
jgi:predicted RNA-binding Zn ribbon-like protein